MADRVRLRHATPDDLAAAGALTVAAYADFTLGPQDPYVARLGDATARARDAELWVAVLEDPGEDRVVGTATWCPQGSVWRELAREGEGEFRMLAVDPAARGAGVGQALVERMLARTAEEGSRAVVISSLPQMRAAHRLYDRTGFVRAPERDWSPTPDVDLITFRKELT